MRCSTVPIEMPSRLLTVVHRKLSLTERWDAGISISRPPTSVANTIPVSEAAGNNLIVLSRAL